MKKGDLVKITDGNDHYGSGYAAIFLGQIGVILYKTLTTNSLLEKRETCVVQIKSKHIPFPSSTLTRIYYNNR